tara:strand:+ start:3421 stop:3657 length:237 start_codon:yes stop_codon:yes gene_type:complete
MSNKVPHDALALNLVFFQKGIKHPNRFIIKNGDIDSRNSKGSNFTKNAPNTNDNASRVAGKIEAEKENSILTTKCSNL